MASEAGTVGDGPAQASESGALAAGAQVGRFIILHRLGKGAMGAVYAGYDVQLDRKVAIKVIREEIASEHVRRRTLREAQALAKLSHPNVVHAYEVGEHRRRLFVAMECVEGENLRAWLGERRRSVAEVLTTVCAAGRGLAAAHAIGLVHRDVKPDNILVGRDGRARIADFGLVRAYGGRSEEVAAVEDASVESVLPGRSSSWDDLKLTQKNAMVGTPAYMSPEQFRGEDVGPAADQFSFCVTLYEALYGALPFLGTTILEIREQVLRGAIEPPPPGRPVPRWVFRALQRGLHPDPAARWSSLAELLDVLERDPNRRRNQVLLALVTAVVVAVGSYVLLRRVDAGGPRCQGAITQLSGVWDDARRETLGAALVATGDSLAPVTASRVVRLLDEYAESWARMHTETCEGHQRGEMSPVLLDRAMSCLARRRSELGALVEVLGETTGETLHNAVQAAASLSRLAPCQDAEALLAATPPPDDRKTAEEVEALRRDLDRALALENAGRYDDGLLVLEAIGPRIGKVGYPPLTAEAQLREGSVKMWRGEFAASAEALMGALTQGHAARAEGVAAEALIKWIFVVGYGLGRAGEAATWYPFARAMTERLEGRPELAALLVHNMSSVLGADSRLREAEALSREALNGWIELYGEHHHQVAYAWSNLASNLLELGRCEEAREAGAAAERIIVETLGPGHPTLVFAQVHGCLCLECLGERERARQCLRRLLADAPPPGVSAALFRILATAAFDDASFDDAQSALHNVLEIFPETEANIETVEALGRLGQVALARGDIEKADEFFRRAMVLVDRLNVQGPQRILVESGRAEVLLARGDVQGAAVALTATLEGEMERYRDMPWILASARFALARALVVQESGDVARAIELARQAHDDLRGHQFDGERSRIAAWLAARGA